MNRRKLIGAVTLGMLLLLGVSDRSISQEAWGTWWQIAYIVALCAALFVALYDRNNLADKAWDFNPKRGLLYFSLGWIAFPLMIGIEAISGSDFALGRMLLGTLAL